MVLSDRTIKEGLDKGRIVISPLDPEDFQQASVDLHLDRKILVFTNSRLPITLYFGMKIRQISYLRQTAADRLYGSPGLGSKYQGQPEPAASRFDRDFQRYQRTGNQENGR